MRKLIKAVLPFATLATAFAASQADASTHLYPGVECQPIAGSTCISYDNYGVRNNCSSAQMVDCPLSASSPGSTLSQATAIVYDRHSSDNVSCSLQISNLYGDLLYNVSRVTSGENSSHMVLSWLSVNQTFGFTRLRCSIPAVESGEYSHVVGYFSETTN